jgi:hypothetical protein
VGNRVGIGRGPGAKRKEGACHSLARRGKGQQERVVSGNGPFRAPRGLASGSPDVSGIGEEDSEINVRG